MSHEFYFINKSYFVYGSLCMGFGLIQLGFGLLVKLGVIVLVEVLLLLVQEIVIINIVIQTSWNMVLACLMWLIWWKRNNRTFEDIVRSIDLLKPILVGTLFKWGKIWGVTQCISISEFLLSIHISS